MSAAEGTDPVTYAYEEGVATITLARPDSMNSLTTDTKVALKAAVHRAAADDQVRAVILTGTGRAFCVGQDLTEHVETLRDSTGSEAWFTVAEHYTPIALSLATMPKPVLAAVNGVAAGAGAALAFACDLRIVADSAGFNTAFAGIGLSCDTGTSWTLPRLIGTGRAMDLLLRPRTVRADEALAIGLATEVVPAGDLADVAGALALRLAAGPTMAYASIRRAVAFAATHSLSEALSYEEGKMVLTGDSDDHRGAVDSFLAKRPAVFEGR